MDVTLAPQQELNRLLEQIGWSMQKLTSKINRKHATVYKWCTHWKPPAIPELVLVRLRQVAAGKTPAPDTDDGKWIIPVSRAPRICSCMLLTTIIGRLPMGRPAPPFTLTRDNTSSPPTLSNVTITRDYID